VSFSFPQQTIKKFFLVRVLPLLFLIISLTPPPPHYPRSFPHPLSSRHKNPFPIFSLKILKFNLKIMTSQ